MYYFAYGSNLNQKQMLERCPESKPRFKATLHHYKLIFAGWSRQWRGGVASIKSFRGEKVHGAIYEVTEACLRRLDKHEAGYTRLNVRVFNEDDDAVEAITYIKTIQSEETRPSEEYLTGLRQGYRDWGLM